MHVGRAGHGSRKSVSQLRKMRAKVITNTSLRVLLNKQTDLAENEVELSGSEEDEDTQRRAERSEKNKIHHKETAKLFFHFKVRGSRSSDKVD